MGGELRPFGWEESPPDGATRELLRVLMEILDAFAQPAWLVARAGTVLHANASAGALDWVPTSLGAAAPLAGPALRRIPIAWRDIDGWVVVMSRPQLGATDDPGAGLSPRLAAVAKLLAQSCSDKDIAERLGVSHATARTYVARVYRKLRVHRRCELLEASSGERTKASLAIRPPR